MDVSSIAHHSDKEHDTLIRKYYIKCVFQLMINNFMVKNMQRTWRYYHENNN